MNLNTFLQSPIQIIGLWAAALVLVVLLTRLRWVQKIDEKAKKRKERGGLLMLASCIVLIVLAYHAPIGLAELREETFGIWHRAAQAVGALAAVLIVGIGRPLFMFLFGVSVLIALVFIVFFGGEMMLGWLGTR